MVVFVFLQKRSPFFLAHFGGECAGKESADTLQRNTDMSTIGCNRIQVLLVGGVFNFFVFVHPARQDKSNSIGAYFSFLFAGGDSWDRCHGCSLL